MGLLLSSRNAQEWAAAGGCFPQATGISVKFVSTPPASCTSVGAHIFGAYILKFTKSGWLPYLRGLYTLVTLERE